MWGSSANADSQSRYNNMRATVQAVQGGMTAIGGMIGLNGQAVGAGLGQAATAGVNAMISNSQAQSQAHIQNQLTSGASQISQTQQRAVRDTNFELAQFSANGDYENAVASVNAQVQDTQVIPPSVIGQTSGTVTAMVAYNMAIVRGGADGDGGGVAADLDAVHSGGGLAAGGQSQSGGGSEASGEDGATGDTGNHSGSCS